MSEVVSQRPFGVWTATALVVGTMIGAGIFVLPGQLAPFGWTGAGAWLVAGAGAMLIAVVLVELTKAMPAKPSVVAICGEVLGAPAGAMIGWSYWISCWASNALVATTAARYISTFYPPLSATPLRSAVVGTAIVAALTAINLRGARGAGRLQVAATVLKVMPFFVVIGIVGWLAMSGESVSPQNTSAPFAVSGISAALGLTFFAVMGFETAALVTERVKDPARNILRATLGGLAGTVLLYLIVCTGMAFASPTAELAGSTAPVAWFVGSFLGHEAALLVALFAAISGIGYLNGIILQLGEVPLGAVRGGLLPAWIARTNARDVAYAPLLLGSVLSVALMLVATMRGGGDVLDFMLKLTTASLIWLYIGACVAALKLGLARVWAGAGLIFSLWVLYSTGFEAAAWGIGLVAAGAPLYFLTIRSEARPATT